MLSDESSWSTNLLIILDKDQSCPPMVWKDFMTVADKWPQWIYNLYE